MTDLAITWSCLILLWMACCLGVSSVIDKIFENLSDELTYSLKTLMIIAHSIVFVVYFGSN